MPFFRDSEEHVDENTHAKEKGKGSSWIKRALTVPAAFKPLLNPVNLGLDGIA